MNINGSAGSTISAGGIAGIGTITVKGNVDATIMADVGGIKTVTVNGNIAKGSLIAAGTPGIGTMSVKGSADMSLMTGGVVKTLTLGGSAKAPVTLSGLFDVKSLGALNAPYANVDGLRVRAAGGLGKLNVLSMMGTVLSAGLMGDIRVSKNLEDSLILSGYDIGANYQYEYGEGDDLAFSSPPQGTATANIGAIFIGGTMSGTSIAANVKCGDDRFFGTTDDVVHVSDLTAGIKSLTVKGAVVGGSTASGIQFGVVGQTMGAVTIGGKKQSLPYTSEDGQVSINLVG